MSSFLEVFFGVVEAVSDIIIQFGLTVPLIIIATVLALF